MKVGLFSRHHKNKQGSGRQPLAERAMTHDTQLQHTDRVGQQVVATDWLPSASATASHLCIYLISFISIKSRISGAAVVEWLKWSSSSGRVGCWIPPAVTCWERQQSPSVALTCVPSVYEYDLKLWLVSTDITGCCLKCVEVSEGSG